MSTHPSQMSRLDRWSYHFGKWLLITIGCAVVAWPFAAPYLTVVSANPPVMRAVESARIIANAMRAYAEEHGGRYPDGITSNDLFRHLIKEGIVDELAFSGVRSCFSPDSLIGEAPEFDKALEPGECHWSAVRGMKLDDPGHLALIFENPVDQTWPPVWNANKQGHPSPGRAQRGSKIVIGRNDGSIAIEKLAAETGDLIPVKDTSLFSHSPDRLLDPPFAMPEPAPAER